MKSHHTDIDWNTYVVMINIAKMHLGWNKDGIDIPDALQPFRRDEYECATTRFVNVIDKCR